MFKHPISQYAPVRVVYGMVTIYFDKHISRSAAQLAYFLTLTIFPILICVNAVFSSLHLDVAHVLDEVAPFLPSGVVLILHDYMGYLSASQSSAMLTAGAFTTILLASGAVRAVMNITEEIYGRTSFHGLWQLVASIVISILLLVSMYLSVVVVLTGNWFFNLIEDFFHLEHVLERFGTWQWMKYLLLFGMVFLVILLLYRASLPLGKPRPPVVSGAFLASLALAAASMLFSYFIDLSTRYSLVYGSLASVMILLVWLYLCGHILILGNVFNCVCHEMKQERDHKTA